MSEAAAAVPNLPSTDETPSKRMASQRKAVHTERRTSAERPVEYLTTPRRTSSRLRARPSSSMAGGAATLGMATRNTPRTRKTRSEMNEGEDGEADQGSMSESVSRATDTPKTLDNLEKWRKADLVIECRRRGLRAYGTKRELRDRIRENIEMTADAAQVFGKEETMEIEHLPELERNDDGKEFEEVTTRRKKVRDESKADRGDEGEKEGDDEGWAQGTANVSESGMEGCSEEETRNDYVDDMQGGEELARQGDGGEGNVEKPTKALEKMEGWSVQGGDGNIFDRSIVETTQFEATELTVTFGASDGQVEHVDANCELRSRHLSCTSHDNVDHQSEPEGKKASLELLNSDIKTAEKERDEANHTNDELRQGFLDGVRKSGSEDGFIATFSASHAVEVEGVRGVACVESKAVIIGAGAGIDQDHEMKEDDKREVSQETSEVDILARGEVGATDAAEGMCFEGKESTIDLKTKKGSSTEGENVQATNNSNNSVKENLQETTMRRNTNEPGLDGSTLLNIHESANAENERSCVQLDTSTGSDVDTKNSVQRATSDCDAVVPLPCMTKNSTTTNTAYLGHKNNKGDGVISKPESEALHPIQRSILGGDNSIPTPGDGDLEGAWNADHAETVPLSMEIETLHDLPTGRVTHVVSSGIEDSVSVGEPQNQSMNLDSGDGEEHPTVEDEKSLPKSEDKKGGCFRVAKQRTDHSSTSMDAQESKRSKDWGTSVPLNPAIGQNVVGCSLSDVKDASDKRRELKAQSALPKTTIDSGILSRLDTESSRPPTATVPTSPPSGELIERNIDKSVANFHSSIDNPKVQDLDNAYTEHEQDDEVKIRTERRSDAPFISSEPLEDATNPGSHRFDKLDASVAEMPSKRLLSVSFDNSELKQKEEGSANLSKHAQHPEQMDRGDDVTRDNLTEIRFGKTFAKAGTLNPATRMDCETKSSLDLEGIDDDKPSHFSRLRNETSNAVHETTNKEIEAMNTEGQGSFIRGDAANPSSTDQKVADSKVDVEFNFNATEGNGRRDSVVSLGYEDDGTFSESPLPSPREWSHTHNAEATDSKKCRGEEAGLREEPLFPSSDNLQTSTHGKQDHSSDLGDAFVSRARLPRASKSGHEASETIDPHGATLVNTQPVARCLADEDDSFVRTVTETVRADDVVMIEEGVQEEQECKSDVLGDDNACEGSSSEQHEPEPPQHDVAGVSREVSGDDQSSHENISLNPGDDSSAGNRDPAGDAAPIIFAANGNDGGQSGDSPSSQGSEAVGAVMESEQRSSQGSWESEDNCEPSPRSRAPSDDEEKDTTRQPSRAVNLHQPPSNEIYIISSDDDENEDEDEDDDHSDNNGNGSVNSSGAGGDGLDYGGHFVIGRTDREEQGMQGVDVGIEDEVIAEGREVALCFGKDEAEGAAINGGQSDLNRASRNTIRGSESAGSGRAGDQNRTSVIFGLETNLEKEASNNRSKRKTGPPSDYVHQEPQTLMHTRKIGEYDENASIPVDTNGTSPSSQRGKSSALVNAAGGERSGLRHSYASLARSSRQSSPPQSDVIMLPPLPSMVQEPCSRRGVPYHREELKHSTVEVPSNQHGAEKAQPKNQGVQRRHSERARGETRSQADVGVKAKDAIHTQKRQRTIPPFVPVLDMPSAAKTLRALEMTRYPGHMLEMDRVDVNRCLDFGESNPRSILERLSQIEERQTRKHFKPFRDTIRNAQGQVRELPSLDSTSEVAFRMGSVSRGRRVVSQPTGGRKVAMRMLHSRPSWDVRALAAQSLRRAQQVAEKVTSWQSEASPFDFGVANGFQNTNGNGSANGKRTNVFSLEFEASGSARKRRK